MELQTSKPVLLTMKLHALIMFIFIGLVGMSLPAPVRASIEVIIVPPPHPDLFVIEGGYGVKGSSHDSWHAIVYWIDAPYPATELIAAISDQMEMRGFNRVRPHRQTTPSNDFSDWTVSEENLGDGPMRKHVWVAEWVNGVNEVIRYEVAFFVPLTQAPDTVDSNVARVTGTFDPDRTDKKATKNQDKSLSVNEMPNKSFQADRDPRERGPRPLNSNR